MKSNRLILKYVWILLSYVFLVRFVRPYGLQLYISIAQNPEGTPYTYNSIQSYLAGTTFLISLIATIFVLIDSKNKRVLEWLIIIMTFFFTELGIVMFLFWQLYKSKLIANEV